MRLTTAEIKNDAFVSKVEYHIEDGYFVMILPLFIAALALLFMGLLFWSFRNLPKEGWQILACVPISKLESGMWKGVALTYYGLFAASSVAVSVILFFVMMGSISVTPLKTAIFAFSIIFACLPFSRLLARLIEDKQNTLTIGGASFAAIVTVPAAIMVINHFAGTNDNDPVFPIIPTLGALSVSYTIGEGLGRLACISFGCCYGKRLSECGQLTQRLFSRYNFVFSGETKKIAYESCSQRVPVVPVQAITASLYVAAGLIGLYVWLSDYQTMALGLTIVVTQGWRFLSEFLRSDFRGFRQISAYQIMALMAIAYTLLIVSMIPTGSSASVDLLKGFYCCLDPIVIFVIQFLSLIVFLFTGVSSVIGSKMSFFVHKDRV